MTCQSSSPSRAIASGSRRSQRRDLPIDRVSANHPCHPAAGTIDRGLIGARRHGGNVERLDGDARKLLHGINDRRPLAGMFVGRGGQGKQVGQEADVVQVADCSQFQSSPDARRRLAGAQPRPGGLRPIGRRRSRKRRDRLVRPRPPAPRSATASDRRPSGRGPSPPGRW